MDPPQHLLLPANRTVAANSESDGTPHMLPLQLLALREHCNCENVAQAAQQIARGEVTLQNSMAARSFSVRGDRVGGSFVLES